MNDPVQAFKLAMLAALGHAPELIEPGRLQRFATSDKRGDSAGWCKLFVDLRGGVYGCNRAGVSEAWKADRDRPMTRQQRAELARQIGQATAERESEQRQQWAVNAERIKRLWAQCVPLVPGDPVTLYLKRRGFGGVWPLPACLRLHRALPCWNGDEKIGVFPAIVAPLVAPGGRVVSLHRTYLAVDGRKADLPSPKKLTATAGPLAGACIPLHEPQRGVIGIAEGIETALAAWLASGVPTVAAYSAGNLAAWQWPVSVQRLAIFADNDRAGREAADELRARALSAGIGCEVLTPSDDGADWCDVLAQHGAVTIEGTTV
ncbi:MAG: toprim domain-containing protein [Rubrivivax sp.]|nr:toprim domain-containing protein [Rubrivivax sp.]